MSKWYRLAVLIILVLALGACDMTTMPAGDTETNGDAGTSGDTGSDDGTDPGGGTSDPVYNDWTWIAGNDVGFQQGGTYGTQGTTDAANTPGSRESFAYAVDSNDNLWVFGGDGHDSSDSRGYLNDLWRFDGTNWTWVSGSDTRYAAATYGTKGVAAPGNVPGARQATAGWIDDADDFWIFGGFGDDSADNEGVLNDLWRFDGTNWTWMSGSNTHSAAGTYGTKGIADAGNVPGARTQAMSWTDTAGNFWLFGGSGSDGSGSLGSLNDLWKFDGANWTWVAGSDESNMVGTYGTQGTANEANSPGGRVLAGTWSDDDGNLWLFGGLGYDASGSVGSLNDLWVFDGTSWTWIAGSSSSGTSGGTYGTQGVADAANEPGERYGAVGWADSAGDVWVFGGGGYDAAADSTRLNDLWRFDGTNWTWISGDSIGDPMGSYGTLGTPGDDTAPGGRTEAAVVRRADGSVLFFGGSGFDSVNLVPVILNDVWRYRP